MKCFKFIVVAFNICFLVLSLILVSVAASPRFIFGDYFSILATYNNFGSLTLIWIGSGFALMGIIIFGISGTSKESTIMVNLYAVLLSLVFILQIVTATSCILLGDKLNQMVHQSLESLMTKYRYNNPEYYVMNWIQSQYKCCGNNRPSDWYDYDPYSSTKNTTTRKMTTETATIWDDSITSSSNELSLPFSCCNRKCESFYTMGCFIPLHEDLSRIVGLVGSISTVICVAQFFGIISAFILLRKITQYKTNRITSNRFG